MHGRPTKIIRKRTVFYGFVLLAIISALTYSLATRIPLLVDVIRDRGELYRESAEGMIENSYQLKVMNKSEHPRSFRVTLVEPEGVRIVGVTELEVNAGTIRNLPLTLEAEPGALKGMVPVRLHVVAIDDPKVERYEDTRFFAP
jgi:polyferredoxin